MGIGVATFGLGVLVMAVQRSEERREKFLERLSADLEARGLAYVSATFGRAAGNLPVWRVTLHTPDDGVRTVRVVLPADAEPYADDTCTEVVSRVAAEAA